MNKAMHLLLLIGLSVILASCGKPPAADEADPQRDQGPKARLTVVGVDRTESWEAMTQLTLGLAEHVLSEAKPGDTLVFRWISDRSYAPSEQFTRVTLPAIERPTSRLDRQGQQRYLAARRALAGAYQDGMRQIRRFVPGLPCVLSICWKMPSRASAALPIGSRRASTPCASASASRPMGTSPSGCSAESSIAA
jgi:hypothetical protein